MNIERMKAFAEASRKAAEVVDAASTKMVELMEIFSDELQKSVDEYMAERAEAMRNHPAGKGGGTEECHPTRQQMIDYIMKYGSPLYKNVYGQMTADEKTGVPYSRIIGDYVYVVAERLKANQQERR